jgi:hypothetical protein
MKSHSSDLEERETTLGKTIKRSIRKPKKIAPAPESLRGWAKSAVKGRNKS